MPTDYIVFRRNGTGWEPLPGVHSGTRPRAAIEAALEAKKDMSVPDGEYAATPARSWKTITVKVEKALKFS